MMEVRLGPSNRIMNVASFGKSEPTRSDPDCNYVGVNDSFSNSLCLSGYRSNHRWPRRGTKRLTLYLGIRFTVNSW